MSLLSLSRLRRRSVLPAHNPSGATAPGKQRSRRWVKVLAAVAAVLLVIWLVGSPLATSLVNRKLAELPGIIGRAGSVKLALWRGAVEVNDFVVHSRGHEQDVPLVRVAKASMRVAPSALFSGRLGGAMSVDGAEFNIVKRERFEDPEDAADQAAVELKEKKDQLVRWQDSLREAFPVELTRLEMKNSRVRFIDRTYQPNVDVGMDDLHIVATDLQNRPKANGDPLPAKIQIDGVTTGNGKFHANLQVDPIARQPLFTADFELKGMSLPPFNSFLLAYADADVSRGTFEVFMEVDAKDGAYDGYVKPLFHDLDFRTASDKNKNLGERVKEKVVSAVTAVLKNDEQEQVATRAPFAGNFADNDVDIWSTIGTLFRNAFVQALRGGLEGQTPAK